MLGAHKTGIMKIDLGHLQKGQHVFVVPSKLKGYDFPVKVMANSKDRGRWVLDTELHIFNHAPPKTAAA